MKRILLFLLLIAFAGVVIFVSCKKEYSCENCGGNPSDNTNKPPIANAGPDQIIVLPTDSALLDGRSSNDPGGIISSYLWTKISGPVSFIIKPSDSVTKAEVLVVGSYLFELKVTDNGGLSARDTMRVLVDSIVPITHLPIANAGHDTTITLPTNTINLDGSGSSDPDNNIASYSWIKILGQSFNIVNANAVQTQVNNLVAGIYQFELTVTDASGLFSKDTMQVTVNAIVSFLCDNSNRPHIAAQLIPFGTLSQARMGMAVASAGNKIVFAGASLSEATGSSIPNYGSSRVDIYDIVTQTWTTAELSQSRMNIAAVAAGNKIFFAGGEIGDGAFDTYYSNVDIYDVSTNTWSLESLSEPRSEIAAAVVGNKVFFAGGENDANGNAIYHACDKVDIYDLLTNTWSTTYLSEARIGMTAVTVNNKIYFSGGHTGDPNYTVTNRIDVYDNNNNSWSTSTLSEPKVHFAGISVTDKIYWAGGFNTAPYGGITCTVEIKDVNTWNSSIEYLSRPRYGNNAVFKDNKIVFLSPDLTISANNYFDIYDVITETWSIGVLPQTVYRVSIISVNNTIYLAGGTLDGNLSNFSNQVWKLDF